MPGLPVLPWLCRLCHATVFGTQPPEKKASHPIHTHTFCHHRMSPICTPQVSCFTHVLDPPRLVSASSTCPILYGTPHTHSWFVFEFGKHWGKVFLTGNLVRDRVELQRLLVAARKSPGNPPSREKKLLGCRFVFWPPWP